MKLLMITCMMLLFLTSCDIMKSITFINRTDNEVTIIVPPVPENPCFTSDVKGITFQLASQGDHSRIVLLKGFGKWGKSDPNDLADILTISNMYYGTDHNRAFTINPDFLKVKRKGIFGRNLKIIIKR